MKRLKFLFLILLSFFLFIGCSDESEYIEWNNDLSSEFTQYEQIPDWEDYYRIREGVDYESVEVNSDFDFQTRFEETGEYAVQVKITLTNGEVIYETLKVTVVEGEGVSSITCLNAINEEIDQINQSEYLQYKMDINVDYNYGGNSFDSSVSTLMKEYISNDTSDNVLYINSTMNVLGIDSNIEMYTTLIDDEVIIMYSDNESPWLMDQSKVSDYEDSDIEDFLMQSLIDESADLNIEIVDDEVYAYLVISEDSISPSTAQQLYNTLEMVGVTGAYDFEDIEAALESCISELEIAYVFDNETTDFLRLEMNYADFMNELNNIDAFNYMVDITYEECSVIISGISTAEFTYEFPIVNASMVGYTDAGQAGIEISGLVKDITYDPDADNIYYTLDDSNYVYCVNYKTYELNKIYFSIKPDHLYYRDDKLYVTLSDEHINYTTDPEYGGLGVIDTTDFTKIEEFDLDFDPYDIVVDEYGYAYITHGSNQHGGMRSINTRTGLIVDVQQGTYHKSEVYYSEYSGRVYYVELATTFDNLKVYDVNRGQFGESKNGSDRYTEENLSISPDGRYIISLDGSVFELNPTFSLDGVKADYKLDANQGVAWDLETDNFYLAKADGIYVYDSEGKILDIYEYSFSSQGIFYDEGIIISSNDNSFEIINTNNTNDSKQTMVEVISVSYGESFNIEEYIDLIISGSFEGSIVSGSINDTALGNYQVLYHISNLRGDPVDIDVYLCVTVLDDVAPDIEIPEGIDYSIEIGNSFTPPTCTATDNYDDIASCSVAYNGVNTDVIGSYEVIYVSTDSAGNTSNVSLWIDVTLPQLEYNLNEIEISGLISQTIIDPETNSVYYIRANTYEVVKYDLLTSNEEAISFENKPEKILLQDGKLYVMIVHGEHSLYWEEDLQTGEIGIIDLSTYTLDSVNLVTVDPYDIAIIDGYIYIFPGSGQWVSIVSYNINDFSERHKSVNVWQQTNISYDPNTNYIFGITNGICPQSMERYTVANGTVTAVLDNSWNVDYTYGEKIYISGQNAYIFSENGQKYYLISTTNYAVMDYAGEIGFNLSAYYYDVTSNISLFGTEDGYLRIDNNNDFSVDFEVEIGHSVDGVFSNEDAFYVVSYTQTGVIITIGTETVN